MENLLIEIGASTKEFLTGLSEVGEHTKDLGDRLKGIGVVAGAAFAGYTASIMGAVYAYREEEKVGQEVNAILQATGGVAGVTAHAVTELAESLSKSTTFSKLQVERGEEILLTFTRIGSQTFPEASKAVLDLAQRMGGDTTGAAQLLGRALEDPMNGLKKLTKSGIYFTEQQKDQIRQMELSGNMAGAQAIILKQVESQYGGLAHAAAGGTGAIVQVKNVMEELAAKIGAEFAPYIASAAVKLRDLIQAASENEGLVRLTAAVLAGGAAVTGIITGIIGATFAIKQLTGVVETAKLVTEAFGLSAKVAMGATGVGLLVVVAVEIYQHWNTLWPAMKEVFHTFVDTITKAAQGLSRVLLGAFRLDIGEIKAGLAEAANAFIEGAKATGHTVVNLFAPSAEQRHVATEEAGKLGNAAGLAHQKALMTAQDATRRLEYASEQAHHTALLLELQGHTKKVVDLKKQEADTLKKLSDPQYSHEKSALQKHLKEIQSEYNKAHKNEEKQKAQFDKLKLKEGLDLTTAEQAQLVASLSTAQETRREYQMTRLQEEITANNDFLYEQMRFGTAYAEINKFMNQSELKQFDGAMTELAQVSQSKHKELKAIGQGAAVIDMEMKTLQSALAVYAGFQSLPFGIGIPLGLAAAATVEIFGQEKIAGVLGLARGGLVTGGIPGLDSVPVMAQPGELMAPTQNFEEVVGSVAAQRIAKRMTDTQAGPSKPIDVNLKIQVEMKGQAARLLQVQAVQDKALGVYRGT